MFARAYTIIFRIHGQKHTYLQCINACKIVLLLPDPSLTKKISTSRAPDSLRTFGTNYMHCKDIACSRLQVHCYMHFITESYNQFILLCTYTNNEVCGGDNSRYLKLISQTMQYDSCFMRYIAKQQNRMPEQKKKKAQHLTICKHWGK